MNKVEYLNKNVIFLFRGLIERCVTSFNNLLKERLREEAKKLSWQRIIRNFEDSIRTAGNKEEFEIAIAKLL